MVKCRLDSCVGLELILRQENNQANSILGVWVFNIPRFKGVSTTCLVLGGYFGRFVWPHQNSVKTYSTERSRERIVHDQRVRSAARPTLTAGGTDCQAA